ncbi:MAG TPA: MFS transporter [Glaciibacter sp.]|nr:MFS transporter [Glaciibacter sp.]
MPILVGDVAAAAVADASVSPPSSFGRRLVDSVADPVLRILLVATIIGKFGRGVFITVTVLYFTFVVGLTAGEVALILGIASAVGVGTTYLGGRLADRFSARRLLVAFTAVEGVALLSFSLASSFSTALLAACVVSAFGSAANTSRMAIIARAFEGASRVSTRAILRTVTNVAIAIGAGAAGVALLIGTADAYRVVIVTAGLMHLAGAIPLLRLPSRVDRAPRTVESEASTGTVASAAQTGRSPFRDARYLWLTVLSGIFAMQFGMFEVGVPLWIAHDTSAPKALVSVLLILNSVIVILFQVRLSRGSHDLRQAGRVTGLAGVLMVGACLLYAIAAGTPVWFAIMVLVLGATAHAFAEVWSQAGVWGLSFELADEERAGAYQGVFAMGFGLGSMFAPLVVNATALTHGFAGWLALAALFLLSALGTRAIARRAASATPLLR